MKVSEQVDITYQTDCVQSFKEHCYCVLKHCLKKRGALKSILVNILSYS